MNSRLKFAALALVLLLGSAPSQAQVPLDPAQPDPNDPDGTLVEELVVMARDKGPAWWRVSDADTTVYVLGAPGVLPKSQPWDQSVLERRLQGANVVILPFNNVGVGVLGAPGLLIRLAQVKGGPIEDRLPAGLKARFIAAREKAGRPAKRYGYRNELVAGILLVGDAREAYRLTAADPGKTVARLAKARKLKTESKVYDAGPLAGAAVRASAAAQRACLEDALDEVEAGPGRAQRAGAAWAEGDVRGALDVERGYDRCLTAAPGALSLDAKLKADQAAAIERALKTPGHAVAVVQLRPLLSQGGVLDRLRAEGYEVKTPGEE